MSAGTQVAVKVPTAMVGEQQQPNDGAGEGGCLPQLLLKKGKGAVTG